MSKSIGVDIGATAVRIVEISGVDENAMPLIVNAISEPLPPGSCRAGKIVEHALVASALRRAFTKAKIKPYGVVMGVSSPDVVLASAQMPKGVRPWEWDTTIRLRGEELSPKLALADSLLGFQAADVDPESANVTLAVSAVHRTAVDDLLKVCQLARVTPRAFDLAPAATFRGLLALAAQDRATVATVVDLGATKTTVITRRGLRLRSVYTLESGGEGITRAVKGALDITLDAAEQLKTQLKVGDVRRDQPRSPAAQALISAYGQADEEVGLKGEVEDPTTLATRAATAAADRLIDDIADIIMADTDTHPGSPTNSITVCGGGSLLQELPDRIKNRTGIDTFRRRPYINVAASARTDHMLVDGSPNPVVLLEYVTATGLAMWQGGN